MHRIEVPMQLLGERTLVVRSGEATEELGILGRALIWCHRNPFHPLGDDF